MIKIDLITGFLGAGKTTFIRKYAGFLMGQGKKIGILENDHGAVNVDMMLLQDLEGENCGLEMVAGGCDADCHRRRFKTKLIAMGMCGYDRVLIEPSGIFDVDEFFDVLYEEPLSRWYEIGNVIAIVDARLECDLSEQSEYLLASQIANAGKVLLSRSRSASEEEIKETIAHMNRALQTFQCQRVYGDDVVRKAWSDFRESDYLDVMNCGYRAGDYVKAFRPENGYQALYFMHVRMQKDKLQQNITKMMKDDSCGNIFRVKGFVKEEEEKWLQINATHLGVLMEPIKKGQEIIIVIGEHLVEAEIQSYLE